MKKTLLSLAALLTLGFSANADVTDALTPDMFPGYNKTVYTTFTNVTASSDAVYAGSTAGDAGTIQMRSNKSADGIVTTTSGGTLVSVEVAWNAKTLDTRQVVIYGSNTPYTSAADLFSATTAGTELGTLDYSATPNSVTVSGDYKYLGIRSKSGALYLDKIDVTWNTGSETSVGKPTFSPAAGEYYEAINVEILCSTEGATIEYSLDNSTWTAYTAPIVVDKSMTLYARATKDGVTAENSAEYVIKMPAKYNSIAEMMSMDLPAPKAKSDVFVVNFDATVVYQNGAYTYIYDGKDYALYYLANSGMEKGNTLKAGWQAQISNYNNLYEIVPVTTPEKGENVTTFPEPEVVEAAALTAENQSKYITLKGVVLDATTPEGATAFNGTMGDATVSFYNRFSLAPVEAGTYDITGFIAVYNTTVQVYVVSFDEPAVDPDPEPVLELKLDWEQKLDANTNSTAENRFAAANPVTGEILVPNKAGEKIYAISKDGIVEKYNTAGKASMKITTAIGCDTKGNVLLGLGWPNSSMTKNFLLVSADGSEMKELNAGEVDPSYTGGRTDFFGRILGDMMGDGALLNVYPSSKAAIYGIQLANGEIESVQASLDLPKTSYGNPVVTLPMGATYEDQIALGDEAGDLATPSYLYARGDETLYYDIESGEYKTRQRYNNGAYCYGFDFFDLYGVRYFVQSTGKGHYADGFVIYTLDENGEQQVVASEDIDATALSSANYVSINAYPRANGKAADIYEFVAGKYARHYVFGDDSEEPVIEPLYAAYGGQGWDPANPVEFEYADGIYSYTFAEGTASFKMSTTKGADWAAFEEGVICVADDKMIEDNTGETKYALYVGGNADINFGYAVGQWTAYVDLANGLIWATNATDKPAATGKLYLVGINGGFDAVNPDELTYDEAKKVFTIDVPAAPYGFKLSTEKGNWDAFNAAGFHTAAAIEPNVETELLAGSPSGNMTTTATAPYTIEVAGDYSTITILKEEELNVPASCAIIGELSAGSWNPAVVGELKLQDDGYTYYGAVNMSGGHFSICEHAGSGWGNIGTRWGAEYNNYAVKEVDVPVMIYAGRNDNSFDMWPFSSYPLDVYFTVNFKDNTVSISNLPTGVETIDADDAAVAAEYYNLQGIRVNEPVKGQLYIVRKGNEVSKIVL